mmetsp:Transcript_6680/g.15374  ORF Transcript_6680/g.15374 Transcript_6680/m.15374 type:complete len:270 (+) Transcript_6680:938-1747(+)
MGKHRATDCATGANSSTKASFTATYTSVIAPSHESRTLGGASGSSRGAASRPAVRTSDAGSRIRRSAARTNCWALGHPTSPWASAWRSRSDIGNRLRVSASAHRISENREVPHASSIASSSHHRAGPSISNNTQRPSATARASFSVPAHTSDGPAANACADSVMSRVSASSVWGSGGTVGLWKQHAAACCMAVRRTISTWSFARRQNISWAKAETLMERASRRGGRVHSGASDSQVPCRTMVSGSRANRENTALKLSKKRSSRLAMMAE